VLAGDRSQVEKRRGEKNQKPYKKHRRRDGGKKGNGFIG